MKNQDFRNRFGFRFFTSTNALKPSTNALKPKNIFKIASKELGGFRRFPSSRRFVAPSPPPFVAGNSCERSPFASLTRLSLRGFSSSRRSVALFPPSFAVGVAFALRGFGFSSPLRPVAVRRPGLPGVLWLSLRGSGFSSPLRPVAVRRPWLRIFFASSPCRCPSPGPSWRPLAFSRGL